MPAKKKTEDTKDTSEKSKVRKSLKDHQASKIGYDVLFTFPIYRILWIGGEKLLIGGGGGKSYGMPNRLVLATYKNNRFTVIQEFDSGTDTVWSMSPVHWRTRKVLIGHVDRIRSVSLESKIQVTDSLEVSHDPDNPDRKHMAISSNGELAVVAQDDKTLLIVQISKKLTPRKDRLVGSNERFSDVSITLAGKSLMKQKGAQKTKWLVAAVGQKGLRLWILDDEEPHDKTDIEPTFTLLNSDVRKEKCVWKFCRFNSKGTHLYAVTTGMDTPSIVHCFAVQSLDTKAYSLNLVSSRKATKDAATAFSLSSDDTLVCVGDNEGGIYVINTITMSLVFQHLGLHGSPITTLDINGTNKYVASSDLQYQMRITNLDSKPKATNVLFIAIFLITILVIILTALANKLGLL